MRILFLATIVPYPPHGGVYQRTFNILKRVSAVHDVTFVGFEKKVDDKENAKCLREFCKEVYTYRLPDDWNKASLYRGLLRNLISTKPYTAQKYHLAEVAGLIREKIRMGEVDVLHVDITDLATYGDFAPEIPKVLTHHNINSQLWASQAKAESNLLKKIYMRLQSYKFKSLERQYAPQYDMNVTVSPLETKMLAELVPNEQIRLVPNGVDVEYFKPTAMELQADRHVIYAGSPNYYPNAIAIQWWCEEVIPCLRELDLPDVTLTVLGGREKASGKVVEYLENAEKYNLNVPGFVDDIRPYIAKASVYVVPLRSGGGTRLKVLDALAMGKALLSTPIGCEGISVKDGEHLLVADSPGEFARRLQTLFMDQELRLSLGTNGRALVEQHYSWDTICNTMLTIYPFISSKH